MNLRESLKILSLSDCESVTKDMVKKAYLEAAKKFHPDRNPAGDHVMKMVNAAYEFLKGPSIRYPLKVSVNSESGNFSDAVSVAINAIIDLSGLEIEVCGSWVWVSGDTKTHKEILKANGFRFSGPKKLWYFRHESSHRRFCRTSHTMDYIRGKFGSQSLYRSAKTREPEREALNG